MRVRSALLALVVASPLNAALPYHAHAGDGFGAGLFGGLVAGTIVGAAVASGPRYYGPPPVVYAEPAPIYAPTCYWTRGAAVWDEYRGIWVRPRVQVCD
jgi:hypothetical protein